MKYYPNSYYSSSAFLTLNIFHMSFCVFIVNFEQISHCSSVFNGDVDQRSHIILFYLIFIVNSEQISHIALLSLLLTLNKFHTFLQYLYCSVLTWSKFHKLLFSLLIVSVSLMLTLTKFQIVLVPLLSTLSETD